MSIVQDAPIALSCQPIAFVRSPYAHRIDAPHQPTVVAATAGTETLAAAEATIEFVADFPVAAYRDLAGFERIWSVFVVHRSEGWKAEVWPPRGGGKRSVLATRPPHRPNAIGLSAVELVAVSEGMLQVRSADLLDGTSIIAIKPYVHYADAPLGRRITGINADTVAASPSAGSLAPMQPSCAASSAGRVQRDPLVTRDRAATE